MISSALLWALLGGMLIGLLLTLFGGGGSVLATPWLVFVVGVVDTHIAIATSAAAVATNALISLAGQARAGRIKWPCASIFAVSGVAGALAGVWSARQVDSALLLKAFALAMIAIAISMLIKRKNGGNPDVHFAAPMLWRLIPIGFGAGLASGFFGIGGGFLIAPGLMAAVGMTLTNATASSLVSVSLFGSATATSYAISGYVQWPLYGALVAGGVVGTGAGLLILRNIGNRAAMLRFPFALMIIGVAIAILMR